MKKLLVIILSVVASLAASDAYAFIDSYSINRDKLPQEAREMLDEHFPKAKVSMIKVDRHLLKKTDYDVKLTNGFTVEFSNKGEWKSVVSAKKNVPEALVPKPIGKYVAKHYSGLHITGIAKRNIGYDITLSDGTMHRFNLLHQYKGVITADDKAKDNSKDKAENPS